MPSRRRRSPPTTTSLETSAPEVMARNLNALFTAPDLVRLDAVAEFFGRTRADLVGLEDRNEPSHDLRGLASLAERLKANGVDLAQLASLDPDDIRLFSVLVRRLANKQEPACVSQ